MNSILMTSLSIAFTLKALKFYRWIIYETAVTEASGKAALRHI